MFQLKEILNVRPKRLCYCGEPLVGDFCEVHGHGSEIRVDTMYVDVRLQIVDQTGKTWEPFSDLVLDLTLPKNQFLKLLKLDAQTQHPSDILDEIHYEVILPPGEGMKLLSEFLELSDVKLFFGNKYLLTQDRIKWKSTVSLYYLLSYDINSSEDSDHAYLTYLGIPLRRVSDYINWRLEQCQADPLDIRKSLLNSHSTAYLHNGIPGLIIDVEWHPGKRLPSKITFQTSEQINANIKSSVLKLPSQLFQGCQHFVVGQNQQHKARMALEHISYQFTQSFAHFLQTKSLDGHFRKLDKYSEQFDQLIGLTIWPRFEQLRTIGELQNKQLTTNHLEPLTQSSSPILSRSLLIVSCSATKIYTSTKLPAILRYSGITYCFLKSILLNMKWSPYVDLLIVSAKYGLLKPLQPIPFYEQRLTLEIIEELRDEVNNQLKQLDPSLYSDCFVNLSKLYSKSVVELYSMLENENCHIIRTEKHELQKRNWLMLDWLT